MFITAVCFLSILHSLVLKFCLVLWFLALCGVVLSLCGEVLSLCDEVYCYVLCFHDDVLRSSFDVLCSHFMWWGSFMTSSFAPYVIINTARQKTSTHLDGNITGNQQISSHNDKISPHNDKPHHIMTKSHHIIKPHHIIILPQYTMTKVQNIKTVLQDQRNKEYIRKLWLSIDMDAICFA